MNDDRIAVSVAEAACALGVSRSFLRLEIVRGRLQATRLGRRVVVMKDQLERYLNSNTSEEANRAR
jgi:excisionase family DNA binding protein